MPTPAAEEPAVVASAAPASQPVEEMTPGAMASDLASSMRGTIQTALLSDPSDYSVADDNTIEVHPLETLGHYGDWLEIRTQRLRDLNGLAFRTPVEVGRRLRLERPQPVHHRPYPRSTVGHVAGLHQDQVAAAPAIALVDGAGQAQGLPGRLEIAVQVADGELVDDLERAGPVGCEVRLEAAPEHDAHRVQHALLVIDEQHLR